MKTSVLLIALVIVALVIGLAIFTKPSYAMSEQEAKKFFIEDLAQKYPNADVREIMEIINVTQSDGTQYYQLKARVTTGMSTPCPERLHVYYDYPPKNFVAQPPDVVTSGCRVCINEPVCILAFPEEAIIASHTYSGSGEIETFIKANSNATATAAFLDSYGNYTGVWDVEWRPASGQPVAYSVLLSKSDNKVLGVATGSLQ